MSEVERNLPISTSKSRLKYKVKLGIQKLEPEILRGRRVALLTNWSSVNPTGYQPTFKYIHELSVNYNFKLVRVFAPQHGYWLTKQANMQEWYGGRELDVEIYSLYGSQRQPPKDKLADLDLIIVDLQDVGARFYTYQWTLKLLIEACKDSGPELFVLDRPNPIGGIYIEGPILEEGFFSFVGMAEIPIRHGMTIGEMALLMNSTIGANLKVVKLNGWYRDMLWSDTGLQWVPPSPNMPTWQTALVYPGACLLEATNISEGRGTTRPFEMIGVPQIDPFKLVEDFNFRLKYMGLEGCVALPVKFVPTFDKWAGEEISGIMLMITEHRKFKPVRTFVILIKLIAERFEGFRWLDPPYEYEYSKPPIDILWGNSWLRENLLKMSWRELRDAFNDWIAKQEEEFERFRIPYLLYEV